MAKKGVFAEPAEPEIVDPHSRGPPSKVADRKPIAPSDTDPDQAVEQAFDRVTGEAINSRQLKTYAETLAQYHISSEDKFENAEFLNRRKTEWRYVVAEDFRLIGKEANKVGESGEEEPGDRVTIELK